MRLRFDAYPLPVLLLTTTLAISGAASSGCQDLSLIDHDQDGYGSSNDCNDWNADVHPDAAELCNERDDDCDGEIDEAPATGDTTWYADADGDGYGDSGSTLETCLQPAGYVDNGDDCDDANRDINPGSVWYLDVDGDGVGGMTYFATCIAPPGYVPWPGDCDDTNDTVSPLLPELCDGLDNNCDLQIDEGEVEALADMDDDGFGGPEADICTPEDRLTTFRGDCDDSDPAVHPGAADAVADSRDQDCGGTMGPDPHVGYGTSTNSSLQEALSLAHDGNTIWVGPGRYSAIDLDFLGKEVTLISSHLSTYTTIDAHRAGRVVRFQRAEGAQTVLDGFTITGGQISTDAGAGVMVLNASPTIQSCHIINNNIATQGGGAGIALIGSNSLISGCNIENNTITKASINSGTIQGAGMLVSDSNVTIKESRIGDNRLDFGDGAGSAYGAGIHVNASSLLVRDSLIASNTISGMDRMDSHAEGIGLYVGYGSRVEVHGTTITGNRADCGSCDSRGGGISAYYAQLTLAGDDLFANSASNGGGVSVVASSAALSACRIEDNSAEVGAGGGVLAQEADVSITLSRLVNNHASSGGGVYLHETTGRMRNSVVYRNGATQGGGIYHCLVDFDVLNSTIVANYAGYGGGLMGECGEYPSSGRTIMPTVTSSIIAYNVGYNVLTIRANTQDPLPVIKYSSIYAVPGEPNIEPFFKDDTNLSVEPRFVKYNADGLPEDLHLAKDSQLVDRGTSTVEGVEGSYLDVDETAADLGCYGGPDGDGFDLDHDGFRDYFWPGTRDNAPMGFAVSSYDLNDLDSAMH